MTGSFREDSRVVARALRARARAAEARPGRLPQLGGDLGSHSASARTETSCRTKGFVTWVSRACLPLNFTIGMARLVQGDGKWAWTGKHLRRLKVTVNCRKNHCS